MEPQQTLFEALGGEPALRAIVERFIERVYGDAIIGFFFEAIDREQLIEREYELAAMHLCGGVRYSGRPIRQVHAKHPINPGHFRRRLFLLERTLRELEAPEAVIEAWLAHDRRLAAAVVHAPDCAPETKV
ncbi:MAG: group 1 truncated hemoglobin [Myxococcales bacterium]|nr:group 1 truncated hemoglobin [Myxococcales bacterium]